MTESSNLLETPNPASPEELSVEQLCLNVGKELSSLLEFSEFVRVSAIYASSKNAEAGFYRVLKERNPDSSKHYFLKGKAAQASRVGQGLLGDKFGWFFRNYVVLLCASLESFVRAHMFVFKLNESRVSNFDQSKAVKDFLSVSQMKSVKSSVNQWWKAESLDREPLLRDLACNAPKIYSELLPHCVSYEWMNPERYSKTNKEVLIDSAKNTYERSLLVDEDYKTLADLFLLRNVIVHNGSVAKGRLDFGGRTFFDGEFISLSANEVSFFVNAVGKYRNYFPFEW